jgi:hypothetical protein
MITRCSARRLSRVAVAAALVTLTTAATALAASGPHGGLSPAARHPAVTAQKAGQPPPAPLVSRYETATGNSLDRDCGWSRPLPGSKTQSFWLFCDTAIDSKPGTLLCGECFIAGSTAAEGPFSAGLVPDTLSELPMPPARPKLPDSNKPAHFMTNPTAASLHCMAKGDYPARWSSGVIREPASAHPGDFLISYTEVCVEVRQGKIITEGFGVVEYNPSTNVLGRYHNVFTGPSPGQLQPQWLLGTPVLSGGYLYLYAAACADNGLTCQGGGKVFVARVLARPSDWGSRAHYAFYTGTSASGRPQWGRYSKAVTDVPSASPVGSSAWTVDSYASAGRKLVAIEETSIGGDYQVWSASSPAGPWKPIHTGRLCAAGDGCHALIGHPELSTKSDLLVSYDSSDAHHIEVAAIGW